MHRDATGAGRIDFDVIGLSATGEVDVAGVGAPLPGVVEPLALSPAIGRAGAFVASISLLPGVVIPDNVVFTVDRATGAPPAGTLGTSPNIAVTDQVLITDAVLDDAANTLTVTANSSNLFAPVPTLSVTAPVTGAVGVAIPNVTTIPATVTVTSTDGGTATAPVRVINVVTPGVPGAPPAAGGGGGGGCFIDSLF
jgi:hypothetical protein